MKDAFENLEDQLRVAVRARQSFYSILVPHGVGRFRLLEIGAAGEVLRPVNLRQ